MENLKLVKINQFISKYWFLILIILSLPSIWALFVPGFYGASDDLHIAWLFEIDKTLRLGQIPPRFVPDLSFGFGYPLFNFVFPLPFYIGELFHILSLNFVDSIKAVFLVSLTFSAFSMYLLLREFSDEILSLAGAVIYLYTPYRSNDVYNRGDIGESLAFIFLPLLILSIIKTAKNSPFKWVGIGGLLFGGLILTHNITVYMFFPYIMSLGIALIYSSKNKISSLLKTGGLILLGLFCAAYFWLPALIDSSLMKYDTVFNFIDHFPTLMQLIKPYWGYGASVPGPYDGMSFFIGAVNLILLLIGIISIVLLFKKFDTQKKVLLIWGIVSVGVSILMMNFRSTFIWSRLPLLPYFQFPWRFLIMVTFLTPLFIIVLSKVKYGRRFAACLAVLAILLNLNVFKPHDFLGRTDKYYLNRYIPVPVVHKEYYQIQEEYLRLPKDTVNRPAKNYPTLVAESGEIKNQKTINDLSVEFETFSNAPMSVDYSKYNFPGWYAYMDGIPMGVESGLPYGQVKLEIPKGDHQILIVFQETFLKLFLDYISLFSIILAVLISINIVTYGKAKLGVVLSKK